MNDKKGKNIATIVAVLIMIAIAAFIIIRVKGLPKISGSIIDGNYDERKEKRADDQRAIMGEWQAKDNEDFIIDVWRDGEGLFHAIVNITGSEGEIAFYEMSGSWQDNEGGFLYSDCKKSIVRYDRDGNPDEEIVYTDGSGSITGRGESIVWKDKEENTGDGITFIYIGEY